MLDRQRLLAWTLVAAGVGSAWGATATTGVALARDVAERGHYRLSAWDGFAVAPFSVVARVETELGGSGWALSFWVPTWCREVYVHWTEAANLCGMFF